MNNRPIPPGSGNGGPIDPIDLKDAIEQRYLAYALSTIMHRALPDVRDGLKPVHRRILYTMQRLNLEPPSSYMKCARIVGEAMGKYHPHGNQAIYDALARLAQDFSVRYPLVDGQGNFGNIDGDNPAADRYTEARLNGTAVDMLSGLDEDAVDFRPNYDERETEPVVLPAAFPNILANGSSGIAVGMATNIPPHNVDELCAALLHMIKHPNVTIEKLVDFIPGPDFPTGGILVEPRDSIVETYRTGRGGFRLRARWDKEDTGRGGYQIVITEIPYQVQKGKLVEKIADLIAEKKLPLVGDIRDESAEDVRLVIEPKSRAVDPVVMMESLFRVTELEIRFGLNMNVLSGGQIPNVLSLRDVLGQWLEHRVEVLVRRSNHRLDKINHRLEVLDGYLVAYLNIDEVIRIVRYEDDPKQALMAKFSLSEVQAEAILNLRLRSLSRARGEEIRAEHDKLVEGKARAADAAEVGRTAVGAHFRRDQGHARALFEEDRTRQAAHAAGGRPDHRHRSRHRADREGAGHGDPVGKGLDPGHEGPSGRPVEARVQAGRQPEEGREGVHHRQADRVRHQWPLLHHRRRPAAGRPRSRRADPPDGRHRREPRLPRRVRLRTRPQAAGRLDLGLRLHRTGGRSAGLDPQGQAGAQRHRAGRGEGVLSRRKATWSRWSARTAR